MRVRTAALLLRLPLGRRSRRCLPALVTVLRAADAGAPAALRAVARALESLGPETVWRTWAESPPRRWTSPLVAELLDEARVPDVLVDAGWHDWLDAHQDGLWSLLRRWNRPATAAARPRVRALSHLALDDDGHDGPVDSRVLADAAARFGHPLGERARARLLTLSDSAAVDLFCRTALKSRKAAAFCLRHRLAPAGDVERAMFFVRTGQREQFRALDPDGALLALGYRGASAKVRAALRPAMADLGDIDVLRILAGQRAARDDFGRLTKRERAYLVGRFTERGDWDRLWSYALLMPLAEAVKAVHACGGWRPSGEDERGVFEALRAADPRAVADCVKALSAAPASEPAPHVRTSLAGLSRRLGPVTDLDFSPDGTRLALVGALPVGRRRDSSGPLNEPVAWAGIMDLGSGALSELRCDFTHLLAHVAHLGSDTVVAAEKLTYDTVDGHVHRPRIHYLDRDGVRTLDPEADVILGLKRMAGERAFVVTAVGLVASDMSRRLLVGVPDGFLVRGGMLDGLDGLDGFEPLIAAVDPGGGVIALVDERGHALVADLTGSVVNRLDGGSGTPEDVPTTTAALSPSVLVCRTEKGVLKAWHEPLTATRPTTTIPAWNSASRPDVVAWSPFLNRFVAVRLVHRPCLELLEVPATRTSPVPDVLVSASIALAGTTHPAPVARLSPKGDTLAVAHGSTVDVYRLTTLPLRPFIARPMALMAPQDLAQLVRVLEDPTLDKRIRPTLTLLRACLERRLGDDIGIGDARDGAVAGSHEIELGG
ncbi:hypothetical protein [Streptomyces muensis]|uniref:Uncharacterized protein n=1 Tax=Streptomyces muensis TaxID=1077944 RepID=A0A9X1PRN5_STRM4|nr:hypothetical protein [Streptomyces muensis]MCF1592262.1 hypothetical protein [Streptomyces muensis]